MDPVSFDCDACNPCGGSGPGSGSGVPCPPGFHCVNFCNSGRDFASIATPYCKLSNLSTGAPDVCRGMSLNFPEGWVASFSPDEIGLTGTGFKCDNVPGVLVPVLWICDDTNGILAGFGKQFCCTWFASSPGEYLSLNPLHMRWRGNTATQDATAYPPQTTCPITFDVEFLEGGCP